MAASVDAVSNGCNGVEDNFVKRRVAHPDVEFSVLQTGRIQQVGRLPLAQLAPGTYELWAVVKQGSEQAFRSTMLRIAQ